MTTSGNEGEVENAMNQLTIEGLVHSVQFGDLEAVQNAIEKQKLSPDTTDRDGCSLLHWAAINNRLEIARYLIQRSCNVNAVGGDNAEIPLQWAVRQTNTAEMIELLISEGSNIHHKSIFGYDALFLSVQSGHIHIVYILLVHGANPDTVNAQFDTPMLWIIKNKFQDGIEFIRLLLKMGGDPAFKDSNGNNCLHLLVLQGRDANLNLALTIYGNGAPALVEGKNKDGLTPYGLSLKLRNPRFMRFLYDAYFYTHYPKSIPIIIVALTFFLSFVFPHVYGFMYGICLDILLYMVASMGFQGNLQAGSSRISCGWAWGVILTVTASYYYFIAPYFAANTDMYFSSSMDYLIGMLATAIVYTLYQSMYTVPQHLICEDSLERKRIVQKIIEAKPIVNTSGAPIGIDFRLCTTCCTDKSLASIHCSKCNLCVVSLDHHCPFVNNCVGKGNRRIFVLFTLFASMGCLLVSFLSYYVTLQYLCPNAGSGWFWGFFSYQYCALFKESTFTAIMWLAGFVGLWIGCILIGQIHLIATENTTFEIIKNRAPSPPCCTLKAARNVHHFCQTGQYLVTEFVGKVARDCDSCGHHDHSHSHRRRNSRAEATILNETDQKLLAMNV